MAEAELEKDEVTTSNKLHVFSDEDEETSAFYEAEYKIESKNPLTENDDGDDEGFNVNMVATVEMTYDVGISSRTRQLFRPCLCRFCFRSCLCCRNCNDNHYNHDHDHDSDSDFLTADQHKITANEKLLSLAFFSFLAFTCLQFVAAYKAQSKSMMGDAAAMLVDVFTYIFNIYAERRKDNINANAHCSVTKYSHGDSDFTSSTHDSDSTSNIVMTSSTIPMEKELDIPAVSSTSMSTDEHEEEHNTLSRAKRKSHLILDIVPSVISAVTLIIVTYIILHSSLKIIYYDIQQDSTRNRNPNIKLMFIFSFLNLIVDFINIFYFAKADHALGYNAVDSQNDQSQHHHLSSQQLKQHTGNINNDDTTVTTNKYQNGLQRVKNHVKENITNLRKENQRRKGGLYSNVLTLEHDDVHHEYDYAQDNKDDEDMMVANIADDQLNINTSQSFHSIQSSPTSTDCDMAGSNPNMNHGNTCINEWNKNTSNQHQNESKEEANLNMCSAYTHIFADTIRSIAVMIAAIVAETVPKVTPILADASAAVVVSAIILVALLPLLIGVQKGCQELMAIREEEISEKKSAALLLSSTLCNEREQDLTNGDGGIV